MVCFFSWTCSVAGENEKKIVCVLGWGCGVQKWYREIDEAVRAGVITRCPFPKPDWQTANITQTSGPDRHTNAPHPPTQTGEAEDPNLQLGSNGVCGPTDFPHVVLFLKEHGFCILTRENAVWGVFFNGEQSEIAQLAVTRLGERNCLVLLSLIIF